MTTHGRWRWAGLLLAIGMAAVQVVAGTRSPGVADFWRDLYWATSIAHGERFPWAGPPIYGMIELGPWWFYLLAVPVVFGGNAAAVSGLVQGLAALKFPLAWLLGCRLRGPELGFAFVVALVIPGWSLLPLMFPTHTAVAEAALLWLALATQAAWRRMTWLDGVFVGLAAAACLHAHPSTALFVGVAGGALLWRHRSLRGLGVIALFASIAVLSLLPPLVAPDGDASRWAREASAYLQSDVMVDPMHRIPALLRSALVGGAWWGFLLMTPWGEPAVRAAFLVACVLEALAIAGLVRLYRIDRPAFRLAASAAALLLAQVGFLVAVRPVTPIWMMPSCLPPLAIVIGLGWYGWLTGGSSAVRVGAIAAIGVAVTLALAPFSIAFRELQRVRVMPGLNPFMDVVQAGDRFVSVDAPWYPLYRFDRLSAALCEPMVLHGRLASLMEAAFAAPARNACGAWPDYRFGGVDGPPRHALGALPRQADALGIAPDRIIAGMAIYDSVRAVAPRHGGRPGPLRRRQVTPLGGDAVTAVAWAFDAGAADAVVLTNRMPTTAPMDSLQVSVDGQPVEPVGSDGSSMAYRCARCAPGARVHWRIEASAIADHLDLVVVEARGTDPD